MEEQEERERQKEWAALEEQLRQRLELQEAHHDHLELKKQKEEAQRAEDEEFRRQVLRTTYMFSDTSHMYVYVQMYSVPHRCMYICTYALSGVYIRMFSVCKCFHLCPHTYLRTQFFHMVYTRLLYTTYSPVLTTLAHTVTSLSVLL